MSTPMMVPLISFLSPDRLWFLLVVPALLVIFLALMRRRRQQAGRSGPSDLQYLLPREKPWLRNVAVVLALLSLVSLNVAWARPKQVVEVPRERATIIVTIDVSKSMAATDVKPSRLEAAKAAAVEFVNNLPDKFNVALVSFAGTAEVDVNPTIDHGVVTAAIQTLQLRPSTAIGEAIYTALGTLNSVPPDPKDPHAKVPARIVLLSDGASQTGRPSRQAAEEAKKLDVPIYSIAYGTPGGYIEVGGRREPVPVDYNELITVSRVSGGKAYKAESAGQLRDVYKGIGSSVGKEVTNRYAGLALLFALLAALGVGSLAARWP